MASTARLFKAPTQSHIESTEMDKFRRYVNEQENLNLSTYADLHAYSIASANQFWVNVWNFTSMIGERGDLLFDGSMPIDVPNPNLVRANLNYAENLLLSHPNARSKTHLALVGVIEPSTNDLKSGFTRNLTFDQLYHEVRKVAFSLTAMGVKKGDRVVAYSPFNCESIIAYLATATIGAIFSSVASESGVKATLERFEQITPKVIFTAENYRYNGKTYPLFDKLTSILESLPTITHVVLVGQLQKDREPITAFPVDKKRNWLSWGEVIKAGEAAPASIEFVRSSAMTPLCVLYSSGTTGKPKAIVHSTGGLLLSQKMSNSLHTNVTASTVFFQFSNWSWMMAQLTVSTLSQGATLVIYDGSPLVTPSCLWDLVDEYKITTLGVSPRFLQSLVAAGYSPNKEKSLRSLRQINTTGSPLKDELYDWVRDNVGDVWINNGTGGTDICGVFVASCQVLPIHYGELQTPALGMDLHAWNDDGKAVMNEEGNMVILKPFPNLPLGFWGDDDKGSRLHAAYFEEFPGRAVWTQGDWIIRNSKTLGTRVLGRSDGVLNPSGVRFGSAELYDVCETVAICEEVIAIGQKIDNGSDERVILFVKTPPGKELNAEGIKAIKAAISLALSPRHVPAIILACPTIPYTVNGKKLEIACKKLVNGTPLEKVNISSAEDPSSLQFFINNPALALPPAVKRESKL